MADGISELWAALGGMNWPLFLIASAAVIAAPGQDMILVLTRGAAQGRAAGVAAAFGVGAGLLGHTALAALGLGALIAASTVAFTALKWIGAAYLIWLGIRMVVTAGRTGPLDAAAARPGAAEPRRIFWQGAASNIANPKIAVFFFAYLPQFAPADATGATAFAALLSLGLAFSALTIVLKTPVGFFAGLLSDRLRRRPSVLAWMERAGGATLIALGAALAADGRAR